MKFVALLSGGKDSVFNTIKSLEYGHELLCVANLLPPSSFPCEEMNSFMYQTAASSVVPCIAECLGVPIVRREIKGTAVSQGLEYNAVKDDEVEDLFELLKDVLSQYPEVTGVSCGAIVSTYQRLRVENVCGRLGLTSLSYLWQRDRSELLKEIIASDIEAVLVKVAGAGLDPYKHLGKSLRELYPTLKRLHEKYGLDLCGEGGEYESIVLDCRIFKKKIVLEQIEVVCDSEDASVGNLKIISCKCVEKDTLPSQAKVDSLKLPISSVTEANSNVPIPAHEVVAELAVPSMHMTFTGLGQSDLINPVISSGCCPAYSPGTQQEPEIVALQVQSCFRRLVAGLQRRGVELVDVAFVHLYIADIALFGAVNSEYCKWFGVHPPSRSCVALPLPCGVAVALEVMFLRGSHAAIRERRVDNGIRPRQVLHVQSMSEWAPLCIGPYSQANTLHDALHFIAGQIPLNPALMQIVTPKEVVAGCAAEDWRELDSGSLQAFMKSQLRLSFRHALRVLECLQSDLSRAFTCVVYVNTGLLQERSEKWADWHVMREAAEEALTGSIFPVPTEDVGGISDEEGEERQSDLSSASKESVPACSIILVGTKGIPRNALVEVEIVALKSNGIPSSLFTSASGSVEVIIGAAAEHRAIDVVNAFPGWGPTQPAVNSDVKATWSMKSLPRSLAVGAVEVHGSADFSLSTAAMKIATAVADMMVSASVSHHSNSLSALRVFFLPTIDQSDLQLQLGIAVGRVLGSANLSIILLPVLALEGSITISAQLLHVDLVQIDSESWVYCR